ncbi:MAG: D-alanyl-D-alanine carboxypeptidase/D-alanyl-D-alanine-endopeptidase [Gemmatimonadota bacterium]
MRAFRHIALVAFVAGCATVGRTGSPAPGAAASPTRVALRQFIDSMIGDSEFRSANWGILIVDPDRHDTLYSLNADKLFMPASNMKLVTGATAVTQLGLEYRWTTTLFARGAVRDGTLLGDLVVRGNGDPSVSAHMQKGDALAPLRALADSLRAHGITRIQGRLAAAPSPFVDSPLGYGWSWSDLDDSYSAGVDALYFNEGFTEIVVKGGARPGEPVSAYTRPASSFPSLIVKARTVAKLAPTASAADTSAARIRVDVSQDSSRTGVLVTGNIVAGDSTIVEITFRDQTAAYLSALREAFAAKGIIVDNASTDAGARNDSLFAVRSPSLREVLPFFQKPSQNQIGELLFKTLALEKTGIGRADSASRVVSRQLVAWGAEADGFAVRDGSGLSRHDYLAPRTIIHVLHAIRQHPDFNVFFDALPIAGVDGTIRARMKGTPAEGNVHAKTGTLDKARALSGFVKTADGRVLLFSALCNNYSVPTRRVDRVTDALGARLASMRLDP